MIQITFEGDGLQKRITSIQGRVNNLKPFLKEVGDFLVKRTKGDFANGGNPKWQENAFRTPVLLKSGKLRDSVKILGIDDNSVTVGTESKQRFHNFGYSYRPTASQRRFFFWKLKSEGMYQSGKKVGNGQFNVPKRQFLKFQDGDEAFIASKLQSYIVKD